MARGVEGNEISTKRPPTLKSSTSSQSATKNQKTLLGFFQKQSGQPPNTNGNSNSSSASLSKGTVTRSPDSQRGKLSLTPAPSSDAAGPPSPEPATSMAKPVSASQTYGLLSPARSSDRESTTDGCEIKVTVKDQTSSPSRKVGA